MTETTIEEPSPFYMIGISLFSLFLIFSLWTIMSSFKSVSIETTADAESVILHNIFISSPSCFSYQDPLSGRVYSEIDKSKFNSVNLDNCFYVNLGSPFNYGVRLTLTDDLDNQLLQISKNINSGGKVIKTFSRVFIRDGKQRYIGKLITEVWFKNA